MTLRSLLLHDVALKQDQMEEVLNLSSTINEISF